MRFRKSNPAPADLNAIAAQWVVRRDRGLSPKQAAEFECWLATSPAHARAYARAVAAWDLLGRIPEAVGQPISVRSGGAAVIRSFWPVFGTCAAAAAVALGAFLFVPAAHSPAERAPTIAAAAMPASPRQQVLSDGTVVRLNTGAQVAEAFTPEERSVRLLRGEAFFTVTKNPRRPFVVYANGVTVRAVGTAFNVNLESHVVDVLVEEGIVQVRHTQPSLAAPPAAPTPGPAPFAPDASAPLVAAGHRATVRLADRVQEPIRPIEVSEVDAQALASALAWREPLLNLGGATLAEVAHQFRQITGHTMTFADPTLANVRIGGRFPGDDPEGFVRVLEENYGVISHRAEDGTLVLEKAPSGKRR